MIAVFRGRRRRLLALLVLGAAVQAGLAAGFAFCLQGLFDALHTGDQGFAGQQLRVTGAVVAVLLALGIEVAQRRLAEGLGLDYTAELRSALFSRLLAVAPQEVAARRHGALLLPFVGDLAATRQWVSDGLARCVAAAAGSTTILAILAVRNLQVALALLAILLPVVGIVWLLARPLDRAVRRVRRRRGRLSAFVSGRLAAIATIAALGRRRTELRKLNRRTDALTRVALQRAWIVGVIRGVVQACTMLLVLAALLAGLAQVQAGALSAGAVVGAMSLVALLGNGVWDLGRALELWVPGRVAAQRIDALLQLPKAPRRTHVPGAARPQAGLLISHVSVPQLFRTDTLQAVPGDVVLVTGASRSGKSTLLRILAGLAEPEHGTVRLDGQNLPRPGTRAARRLVGYAAPHLHLLPGSLAMNLRYRMPTASDEEVSSLLQDLGMAEFVARCKRGLRYQIRGADPAFATGDYQGLLIARAMLGAPPLLLLDSVDSHLPAAVLLRLAARIRAYPGIVILAASRPELLAVANQVWRIDAGQVQRSDDPARTAGMVLALVPGRGGNGNQ